MKRTIEFVKTTVIGGLVVILPLAAAMVISIKLLGAIEGAIEPIAASLPYSGTGRRLLALAVIVAGCFIMGLLVRTRGGRRANRWLEGRVLERLPAYSLLRNIGKQVAGEGEEGGMAPALAEIEDALVPAFIVEELDDGRLTVFVPAVPTPTVGAVYILPPERVHRIDVPITQLVSAVTRWGSGAKELVAAMAK